MVMVDVAGSGFQVGSPAVTTITAANYSSGLVGPSTAAHPSFTLGTMAARRGAPPFFRDTGGPPSASSTTKEAAPTPLRLFGRVVVVDRRLDIRRRTWSPAARGAPPLSVERRPRPTASASRYNKGR
jgi:hypothetical protein